MRIAVIDLGTNTCNLLIAETEAANIKILHQSKQLVKLGDDKIKTNEISEQAIKRTLNSFREHQEIINKYNVGIVKVITRPVGHVKGPDEGEHKTKGIEKFKGV